MTAADHAEPQLRATSLHEIITTAETEGAGGKVMIARIPSSGQAVDDFVAGEIPLKQQTSTRFNRVGRNSLTRNKLKIRRL
jgi:hypothetical protein